MRLNVMTYNIRVGLDSSIDQIAASIRTAGIPDILAIQEIAAHWTSGEQVDQAAKLAHLLGMQHIFHGALTSDTGGQFGLALLAKASIETQRVVKLPRDQDEQRILVVARVETSIPVTVITSHFSVLEPERRMQARAVADAARSVKGPLVVLGDFNAWPDSEEYAVLTSSLTDCFEKCGVGPAETWSVSDPNQQIDYILVNSHIQPVEACRVLRDVDTSDHFPLVARIEYSH